MRMASTPKPLPKERAKSSRYRQKVMHVSAESGTEQKAFVQAIKRLHS